MTACTKKSFRPTLETLEDRCLPSTSPWALLAQQMLQATDGVAAMVRTGTPMQATAQAQQQQVFQQDPAVQSVSLIKPVNIFVHKGETLGQALNRLANVDFRVWRDARLQTKDYKIQFQYTLDFGRTWIDAPMSASGKGIWEDIHTDPKFNPLPSQPYLAINIRVRVTDLNGHAVTNWYQPLVGSNVFRNWGDPGVADTRGNAGQTNTVDGFLMQTRMHDWTHMSETGSPNLSPFHHGTNGMA